MTDNLFMTLTNCQIKQLKINNFKVAILTKGDQKMEKNITKVYKKLAKIWQNLILILAFRCCYCYYWNPARKQRPTAPKLQEATAAKQESGSESTDEDEAVKTSDEKPSKEENEKSEVIRRPITPVENVTTDEEDLAKGSTPNQIESRLQKWQAFLSETEPVAEKSIEEKKED